MIAKSKIITPFDKSDPFIMGLGKGSSGPTSDSVLLETGDDMLLETNDYLLME